MQVTSLFASLMTVTALALPAAGALAAGVPPCYENNGQAIGVINSDVLEWEYSTPDQYLQRAHIQGRFVRYYGVQSGHYHFAVQIGQAANQAVEIVYNISFGALPQLNYGDVVEVCGDYITSTGGASDPYPVSPDRAIMHWVHRATNNRHEAGYVAINGVLYGEGNGRGD